MTESQLRDFLSVFDRSTAVGRRDYAMALCQVDMGLRACEVAGLCLEDIDWRNAILRINTTKVKRAREFPLPVRVGRAISRYLRYGRFSTFTRSIFVRHGKRHGFPVSTHLIRWAMRRAYAEVQGCEHWTGTHVLRHTAATLMLRRGVSLKEIADVLGHQSIETTTIYTKVDLPALGAVALPWPEAQLD